MTTGNAARRVLAWAAGILGLYGCTSAVSNNAVTASAVKTYVSSAPPSAPAPAGIRMVLWLTIDQMGSNLLDRQTHHLPGHAVRNLIERGCWFSEARYSHSITETAPGHATLFTGTSPSVHGIVANEWFDRVKQRTIPSVADDDAQILSHLAPLIVASSTTTTARAPTADNPEPAGARFLGPTNQAAATINPGRSPRMLKAPTIGDALLAHSSGAAQVVSISAKDRGAILPAGWGGTAFWLGPNAFVTSTYYATDLPSWFLSHVKQHPLAEYLADPWTLMLEAGKYRARSMAHPNAAAWGPQFPHVPGPGLAAGVLLKQVPAGDRASLDLARAALTGLKLGKDDVTDLLAVSLSSLDYVGHYYGPESLEAEDAFVRLGAELQSFVQYVEAHVGANRLLVVLSADHGAGETRETWARLRFPGERLAPSALRKHIEKALVDKFGTSAFLSAVVPPYVTLDHARIAARGKTTEEVTLEVKKALEALPGIRRAIPTSAPLADGEVGGQVRESWYPGRSGDLYVVPAPYSLLLQEEDLAATHGSPWSYDTRVPIILVGPGVARKRVERAVDVRSLAPTVARLLGVPPPAAARAPLLEEALPH